MGKIRNQFEYKKAVEQKCGQLIMSLSDHSTQLSMALSRLSDKENMVYSPPPSLPSTPSDCPQVHFSPSLQPDFEVTA